MGKTHIPTEKELNENLKLVEVQVKGLYIAMLDEKRRCSRTYKTKVLVPTKFNKSDLKRMTPKVLMDELDDFVSMRTFEQADAKVVKTDKTMKRRDMYSAIELQRFERLRNEELRLKRAREAGGEVRSGIQDNTEYDPDTGLPPVINV